ncbi:hypothetical protein F5984_17445 [Rudanella paleaurantiibacter]|uniref:Outer membrane lipoprotein-sorting protein n=1 Tax=Rudanella paleaurantiibacter TaxID=2614655 RepID=A0A7J5TW07_9BACT|nr:hypothetical protein [Rudanella paleaurantiibacter]KAB7728626.1 hypothetical protein F5984_17445 [Rudanella paleaurantiibacter]
MKKALVAFLLAPFLYGQAVAQNLPSAQEVMDKYVAAVGGKAMLAGIQDMRVEMSTEFNGNPVLITRKMKAPNKFVQIINANGMEVMRMTGDGSKVSMGGMQGSRTMEGKDAQGMILMNTLFGELRYAEMGVKSTVAGVEAVNGKDAYKVDHASADGAVTWSDFYDKETGLKVQSVATQNTPRGPMTQTTTFADYKDFKGLKYPTTMAQTGGRAMQMSVDKVKVNDGAKDADFEVK